jgi:ABC-type Fe3+-siderophore transport system permease subunit
MSASHGLSSQRVSGMPRRRSQQARYVSSGAAAAAALLYVLAGTVGSIKLGFCLAMGGVFAVVAILLFLFGQRLVWNLVALLDLGAIIGYFAVAPTRDPHFELWGIAIKASQVILLAALGYLIIGDRPALGHGQYSSSRS